MKFAYLIEPPFNYVDASGHVTGCDVELARHVFGELGITDFDPVETEFAELLPGLCTLQWRMTTGLFGTDERRKHAQFSRPIWALPDGLLIARGNPCDLRGYRSVAQNPEVRLAVIRDQFQHRSASAFGISPDRLHIFETYSDAAKALQDGRVDAYASVGRAHAGFIKANRDLPLDWVLVPTQEKPPAFGSFAFGLDDTRFREEVDEVLTGFLGTPAHRRMMADFGFSEDEINLVAVSRSESGLPCAN